MPRKEVLTNARFLADTWRFVVLDGEETCPNAFAQGRNTARTVEAFQLLSTDGRPHIRLDIESWTFWLQRNNRPLGG